MLMSWMIHTLKKPSIAQTIKMTLATVCCVF